MSKNLFVKTYGCQMNVYDSIRMYDLMKPFGYDKIEEPDNNTEMIVLNTCHIREKAAEKVYSELGRLNKIKEYRKKQNLPTVFVVAGCVGQAEGEEIFARAPYVDIVVGPQSYHNLPDMVAKIMRKDKKHLIELDFIEEEKFDKLPQELSGQGVTAFVSVQEGCDKFCTYCVVPYTRGAEFSRPLEQVYREVSDAVSKGAREVTLLGQNVNGYHGKSPEDEDCDLAKLVHHISALKGLDRIRYTTSHPQDMNQALIEEHGHNDKLMPFLHLPVQSGSNKILKLMNRKHTRETYFEIIDKLREAKPDIILSSDFIVGFPDETDEDFEQTMDLVKRIRFGYSFSFKYSPRPGTPAATRKQLPEEVKSERLQILQKELFRQQFEINNEFIGKTMPVLFERRGKYEGHISGKSPYWQSVYVENASEDLIGQIRNVKVAKVEGISLSGELV